jgi:hypothetical protein
MKERIGPRRKPENSDPARKLEQQSRFEPDVQLNYPCAPAGPEILERRSPAACGPPCRSYHGRMDHLAGEIEKLVRTMPGLTGMDLVRMLHERARSPHQIISICRRLVAEGRLERRGQGGWQKPFTYYPGRPQTGEAAE